MPSEIRKQSAKPALLARARMVVAAHLGWLEGFPFGLAEDGGVRWVTVPPFEPARVETIDGGNLSRATYALNKLETDYEPVLGRLAEDPEAWIASLRRRLELLKPAVHQGQPFPQRLFEELPYPKGERERARKATAAAPGAGAWLDALSWVCAGDPAKARVALDLVPDWAPGFAVLSARFEPFINVILMLRLAQLAADHGRERVQPLASCLFDDRVHALTLHNGQGFCSGAASLLGRRAREPVPDEPEDGYLGRELATWCLELVQRSHRARKDALRLFELAEPAVLIDAWDAWWRITRPLLRRARELRAIPYHKESRQTLRAELERHGREEPPEIYRNEMIETLRHATEPRSSRTAALLRVLPLIPAGSVRPGRLHFANYWTFVGEGQGVSERRIAALLAGFERYLRRAATVDEPWLRPWSQIAPSVRLQHPFTVEYELMEEGVPPGSAPAAYDHLAALVERYGGLTGTMASRGIALFLRTGDAELAARFFESLRAHDFLHIHPSRAKDDLAVRLCRDDPDRFGGVLSALVAGDSLDAWPPAVLETLATDELRGLTRDAVLTGQWDRLRACGTKAALLATAGVRALPRPAFDDAVLPEWARRYPPELHPAVLRLAAALDDAEAQVERWLAADFPSATRLEEEIRAIERRLPEAAPEDQEGMRTRLANLRERLASPPAPGAARLRKMRERLDRAWGRAVFDRWERSLDALLPAVLSERLEIAEMPPWLLESEALSLLVAASRLSGAHRRLAYRLFRTRCGPPPWDLRDAPQNVKFLSSLPHLEWSPWIDGVGTVEAEAANGRRLFLALEDDPLEVFRMGGHFGTCLSPGAFNFFSVFANAADINKRVLYARDEAGKVVGRCLLALTATGEMLLFEPYCHDSKAGFGEVCARFADDLASRMGTHRIGRGRIPVLVATDWYDDGPRDLGRRFEALDDGSPLRRKLASIRPGELLDELRRSLKPAGLNEATLPLVLALPELQARPELAVPLLRLVAEARSMPDEPFALAAHLGLRAGARDMVRRLFLQRLSEVVRGSIREMWQRTNPRAEEVLLQLDPGRLLILLRQTRGDGVRGWLDEIDGNRIENAAAALDALHRPRQALELWRRLATSQRIYASYESRQKAREIVAARGEGVAP
ncbi:MAG: hypothetical protein ACJ75H_21650 [Thermoanaerobaculia bacterium]